jgi:hypothetical protein
VTCASSFLIGLVILFRHAQRHPAAGASNEAGGSRGGATVLLRRGDISVTDVCVPVGWSSLGTVSTRCIEPDWCATRHVSAPESSRDRGGRNRPRRNKSAAKSGTKKHGSRSRN